MARSEAKLSRTSTGNDLVETLFDPRPDIPFPPREKETASRGSPSMPAPSSKLELDHQVQEYQSAKGVILPREGVAVAEDRRVRSTAANEGRVPVEQVVNSGPQREGLVDGPRRGEVQVVPHSHCAVYIR